MVNLFRIISIAGFAAAFGGIAAHCVYEFYSKGRQWEPVDVPRKIVFFITLLFIEQKLGLLGTIKKLVYLVTVPLFLITAITGFYPKLVLGETISGYWLMLHATFATAFAPCLAIVALLWVNSLRFDKGDRTLLEQIYYRVVRRITGLKITGEPLRGYFRFGQKSLFWLIVLLAQPLILSVALVMLPIFEAGKQNLFWDIHRYAALIFAMVAIIHTYLVVRIQMEENRPL
ncbi:MAG: cytochrome b/b6 domain-containing protein [Planctomycetota bacterium]|jgi:cytochrome b subunit of formate dehydrogenase